MDVSFKTLPKHHFVFYMDFVPNVDFVIIVKKGLLTSAIKQIMYLGYVTLKICHSTHIIILIQLAHKI